MLKKVIISSFMTAGHLITVPSIEAKTNAAMAVAAGPQIKVQIGRDRNRNRSRIATRIVRHGRFNYRETLRVTYLPYGGVRTEVLDRRRIWG